MLKKLNIQKGIKDEKNLEKNITISLVFLTNNRLKKTKKSLNSFIKSLYRKDIIEMLILDNASNSETIKYLKELEINPKLKIYYSKKNLGVCRGRKILFYKAKGDVIFSIDSDAILLKERFIDIGKKIILNNQIGLCGPIGAIFKSWEFGSHTDIQKSNYSGKVDVIAGCCQIFKKNILKNVSLDIKFSPFYLEDYDFCFQIKKLGKIIYRFNPDKTFFHEWGKSGSIFPGLYEKKYKVLEKKWKNKIDFIGYNNPKLKYIRIIEKISLFKSHPLGYLLNEIDKQLGLLGLYIKRKDPELYYFLKKLKSSRI